MNADFKYVIEECRRNDCMTGHIKKFLFPKARDVDSYVARKKEFTCPRLQLHNEAIANNPEQLEAVKSIVVSANFMCSQNAHNAIDDVLVPFLVFGPPGTGKTSTIVEAILQLYHNFPKVKILVTCGSNSACDEVALRICKIFQADGTFDKHPKALVRIYARSNERRTDNLDDLLLEHSNMYATQFYPDVEILQEYSIILCTLNVVGKLSTGRFGKNHVGESIFTHVFVDEAASSTEPETLVGLITTLGSNTQLVLSGDHKQLGAIVRSQSANDLGLGKSLFERLLEMDAYKAQGNSYEQHIQIRLRRNYRSHPKIVDLYNHLYYEGRLIPTLADEKILNLGSLWSRGKNQHFPILFHSVAGRAERELNAASLSNFLELRVVLNYVKEFMYFGIHGERVSEEDIGIISPYKRQYLRIQEELNLRNWYHIETGSVETFQGKEKRIIIVSFVRSNTPTLGFLTNPRRFNVTLSRAQSILILIGNPKTLSMNADFKYVIEECRRNDCMTDNRLYDEADGKVTIDEEADGRNAVEVEEEVLSDDIENSQFLQHLLDNLPRVPKRHMQTAAGPSQAPAAEIKQQGSSEKLLNTQRSSQPNAQKQTSTPRKVSNTGSQPRPNPNFQQQNYAPANSQQRINGQQQQNQRKSRSRSRSRSRNRRNVQAAQPRGQYVDDDDEELQTDCCGNINREDEQRIYRGHDQSDDAEDDVCCVIL